jgi:hypothetical protein
MIVKLQFALQNEASRRCSLRRELNARDHAIVGMQKSCTVGCFQTVPNSHRFVTAARYHECVFKVHINVTYFFFVPAKRCQ